MRDNGYSRREFLKITGMGLTAVSLPLLMPGTIASALRRPNIILFLVDDLGWQDTSEPFYHEHTPFNKRYQTPNMERLADQGMKFTEAYACAVCSPTRVSLMTGMNAARHRVTNWTLEENEPTDGPHETLEFPEWNVNGLCPEPDMERSVYATPLPQLLKQAGYHTIHCGKAHLGAIDTPGEDPLNLGFDHNIAGHAAGAPGSYQGIRNFGNKEKGEHTVPWGVPGLEKYHGQDINLTEVLTLEAMQAMTTSQKIGKPFFLYMSHYTVHTPLEADSRFIQKYLDAGLEIREARYASMVEAMDKSLGDLMDYVKKEGIENNTIILFMSDNGGLSAVGRGGKPHTHNLPLNSGKGSAYEGGIREPMMVKWPGVTLPNSECHQQLIIEDFFPTILEIAGVTNYKTVQTIDGKSFTHMFKNETHHDPSQRAFFWHYPNEWGPKGPGIGASSTVRKGDWKLIYYHADRSFELFNLVQDIGETTNLSHLYPEKQKELAVILSNYLKSVDAQMPMDKKTHKLVEYPEDVLNV